MNNIDTANQALSATVHVGFFDAFMAASLIVQFTIIILIALSIGCWAIFYFKWVQFKKIEEEDERFDALFWKAKSLEDINEALPDYPNSAIAKVFEAGYIELRKLATTTLDEEEGGGHSGHGIVNGVDNLQRALNKSIESEISVLETKLNFLATTGSTGPFIGLFGTVLGIMNSFAKIGSTGMASLAVVAPGISEALYATAIGLGAAIPATVMYNHYVSRLKKLDLSLNNFAADFLNITKRNFFAGQ